MSKETLIRLARRVAVVGLTVAVIGVAVGTVQVAADWRAAAAPLDTAPVSMSSIAQDYAVESERASDLANQMDGVAVQISSLQAALITANGGVAGDAANAMSLQTKLDAAKAKLTSIQKQLKKAQGRLGELNRAAARQAAANRAGKRTSPTSKSSPTSSSGGGEDHGDD